MSRRHSWLRTLSLMTVAIPGLATAQEAEFTKKDDPSVRKLELVKDELVDRGAIAVVQGTADAEGLKYSVASLSILQPVFVRLIAGRSGEDVKISLFKTDWTNPERTGSTAGSGTADFQFRTEGGLYILVTSTGEASPFVLMVWAGEELHPPMPDAIVTPAQFKARNPKATDLPGTSASDGSSRLGGGGIPVFVWIIVAAVAGGAVMFFLKRRKQS